MTAQTDVQTDRQTDRQTERQTDAPTQRFSCSPTQYSIVAVHVKCRRSAFPLVCLDTPQMLLRCFYSEQAAARDVRIAWHMECHPALNINDRPMLKCPPGVCLLAQVLSQLLAV